MKIIVFIVLGLISVNVLADKFIKLAKKVEELITEKNKEEK